MTQLAMSAAIDRKSVTLDRIVLATDFSGAAERAAAYAQGLARRYVSSLALAHVVDLSAAPDGESATGRSVDAMRKRSAANLYKQQHWLMEEMTSAGVRTSAHTLEAERPAAALVSFAEGLRADLIVTGTNARHGLKKVIPGSFAEGVIRHATCPVLTIGPKARSASKTEFGFGSIVMATDLGPDAAGQAALALSFAHDNEAELTFCHVMERPGRDISETLAMELQFESELEKLAPQPACQGCRPDCVVESGAVAPRILNLAKDRRADLIVLGAKPDQYWFTHLLERTVGQVLSNAECPVLTLRAR